MKKVTLAIVIMALMVIGMACSKGPEKQLLGKWEADGKSPERVLKTLEVKKDGKITYADGKTGTYEWGKDKETITITHPDEDEKITLQVKIEGDSLTLTFEGEDAKFKRVK